MNDISKLDWVTLAILASRKPPLCSEIKENGPDFVLEKTSRDNYNRAKKLAEIEIKNSDCKIITQDDDNYPVVLFHLESPPVCLFIKGDVVDLNNISKKSIAMVGTRKATPQGMHIARSFARDISLSGVSVVSGLAYGIDLSSHEGCLDAGGITVAVIGSGIGHLGKKESIGKRIEKRGAVISEFPFKYPAGKWTFSWRNRIIAALSNATLVVEAPLKSGALITAKKAMELGRDVMACPGLPGMKSFEGCNRLIKDSAMLVDNPLDILDMLGLESQTDEVKLSDLELKIVSACTSPLMLDELCSILNLPPEGVLPVLTVLDLKNIIKKLPGGTYMKASLR